MLSTLKMIKIDTTICFQSINRNLLKNNILNNTSPGFILQILFLF